MIEAIFNWIDRLPRALTIIISLVLLVMIGIIDSLTVRDVSISIFYILPVSIAAWFLSKWWGLGLSLTSAVVWFAADMFTSPVYTAPIIPYWNAFVMFGIFAAGSLAISALRASLLREKAIAREIQTGLMPKELPDMSGLDFAPAWMPADNVGGDYYDILKLSDTRVAICIADAPGHGVKAALLIANFQATLRLLAAMYTSPRDLCIHINEFMFRNLGPAHLITFFFGIVDTSTNTLVFTNAGQTRPLLVCANGTSCELCDGGIPLGVQSGFPYEEGTVTLASGDFLVLYTDGLVELTNMKKEMFGVQKLTDLLIAQKDHHAAAIRDAILNAVKEFGWTRLEDDLTLLVLSVEDSR